MVTAIMTDNTIAWGGGASGDNPAYGFQIQPVHGIETEHGFNFIARGIIPIVGAPQSYYLPYLGNVGGTRGAFRVTHVRRFALLFNHRRQPYEHARTNNYVWL